MYLAHVGGGVSLTEVGRLFERDRTTRRRVRLALTRLARHYGLDVAHETRRRGKGIRHWGSEDYRPTLDTWRGTGDQ